MWAENSRKLADRAPWIHNRKEGVAEMVTTDNWVYVKQATTGLLGLLVAQSAISAESKFLSLK